jgi:hypothetical protein
VLPLFYPLVVVELVVVLAFSFLSSRVSGPIAAVMFAGAMFWQLFLPGGLLPGWSRPAGEIREGWLEGPGGLSATAPPAAVRSAGVAAADPSDSSGLAKRSPR